MLQTNAFRRAIRAACAWTRTFATTAVLLAALPAPASPVDFRVIHAFTVQDGAIPNAVIQASDGNAYGTALGTREDPNGLIYRLGATPLPIVLHRLNGNTDGASPTGLTEGPGGQFYGMTYRGGAQGLGTIFKISTAGDYQVVHDFSGQSGDGANPISTLALGIDGNFYGAAGIVFRLAPDGTFTSLSGPAIGAQWLMAAPDGWLYGTGNGAIFKMSVEGELAWTRTMGYYDHGPGGIVWGGDGHLYVSSGSGNGCHGEGCGTILRATPDGKVQVVAKFDGADGEGPAVLVPGPDGSLYGATRYGGHAYRCWRCGGTIFRLDADDTLTTLFTFKDVADGEYPASLIFGDDGDLYGVAGYGGQNGDGTLFRIHLPRH